jgi:hypothetical protein
LWKWSPNKELAIAQTESNRTNIYKNRPSPLSEFHSNIQWNMNFV